jgi:hypothetical protein
VPPFPVAENTREDAETIAEVLMGDGNALDPVASACGDALMMFDPHSETMTFYDLPSYGYVPCLGIHDIRCFS